MELSNYVEIMGELKFSVKREAKYKIKGKPSYLAIIDSPSRDNVQLNTCVYIPTDLTINNLVTGVLVKLKGSLTQFYKNHDKDITIIATEITPSNLVNTSYITNYCELIGKFKSINNPNSSFNYFFKTVDNIFIKVKVREEFLSIIKQNELYHLVGSISSVATDSHDFTRIVILEQVKKISTVN